MNDRWSGMRILGAVLLIVAVILLVVGVIYFTVPAKSLPVFLGRIARTTRHRRRRAIAAVVLGIVLLVVSIVAFSRSRALER